MTVRAPISVSIVMTSLSSNGSLVRPLSLNAFIKTFYGPILPVIRLTLSPTRLIRKILQ